MTQEPQSKPQFYPLDRKQEHKDTFISFNGVVSLLKITTFMESVRQVFHDKGAGLTEVVSQWRNLNRGEIPGSSKQWFVDGIDCEMLQPSKNWKKGKIRFRLILEFAPDEPEPSDPNSTLDDIRKMGRS